MLGVLQVNLARSGLLGRRLPLSAALLMQPGEVGVQGAREVEMPLVPAVPRSAPQDETELWSPRLVCSGCSGPPRACGLRSSVSCGGTGPPSRLAQAASRPAQPLGRLWRCPGESRAHRACLGARKGQLVLCLHVKIKRGFEGPRCGSPGFVHLRTEERGKSRRKEKR